MRIILVEDEPSAMRHLRSIIEIRCSGFEIVGTADSGAEGLEKVRMLKPDVVITDIKMPVMDGIGLVSRIKEEFPHIYSVIVSGYQDFEYAKGAIQSGVVDYLLKPVNAGQLRELLDVIREKLLRAHHEKSVWMFSQLLSGIPVEPWQIEKYLPFKSYSAAVLRENGLPSRFCSKCAAASCSSVPETYTLPADAYDDGVWVIPGRDEHELVFFYTPEIIDRSTFEALVDKAAGKIAGGYHTVVFAQGTFELTDCKRRIAGLSRILDNNTVIGCSQTIHELSEVRSAAENNTALDGTLAIRLGFLVSNGMHDELKQEFVKLFAAWEKEQRTQLWVENVLRQTLHQIEKHSVSVGDVRNCDTEFLLDEALCYSASFGELMANIWDLIEKILQRVEKKDCKVDTPAFFNSIQRYLEQNLSEPLSLQSVCAVFGISQTYLSRLFRKYKNMSFNECLTWMRVEKAKKLILENPHIHLKDVAAFVGYTDPFYFSRVFRAATGIPPSEFMSGRLI